VDGKGKELLGQDMDVRIEEKHSVNKILLSWVDLIFLLLLSVRGVTL